MKHACNFTHTADRMRLWTKWRILIVLGFSLWWCTLLLWKTVYPVEPYKERKEVDVKRMAAAAVNSHERHAVVHATKSGFNVSESGVVLPFDISVQLEPKVKVLILAYMRSGSTFVGHIYEWNKEVMYVFEPLHYTVNFDYFSKAVRFWDRRPLYLLNNETDRQRAILEIEDGVLQGYFNCSFLSVHPYALSDPALVMGRLTAQFWDCTGRNGELVNLLRCLPLLQKLCSQARAVVLKTIRYTIARAAHLLTSDPQVKIIHLVRDPRGSLSSAFLRRRHAAEWCKAIEEDLTLSDSLQSQFPERVLRVRYEDVALRPFHYARKLLQWAGLQLSPEQERHITLITQAKHRNSTHGVEVKVTNSSEEVLAWKRDIKKDRVIEIDQHCRQMYTMAGYLPLHDMAQIKNLSVPTMLDVEHLHNFLQ